jgi:hypothetical protein
MDFTSTPPEVIRAADIEVACMTELNIDQRPGTQQRHRRQKRGKISILHPRGLAKVSHERCVPNCPQSMMSSQKLQEGGVLSGLIIFAMARSPVLRHLKEVMGGKAEVTLKKG